MDAETALKLTQVLTDSTPIITKAITDIVDVLVKDLGTPEEKAAYLAATVLLHGLISKIVDDKFAGEGK